MTVQPIPGGQSRPNGPTTETGYESYAAPSWGMFASWANLQDPDEVAELTWPNNIRVYHRMRTDAQVDALIRSVTMPVRNLIWEIDPNGARDELVQQISTDMNLPIKGSNDEIVRGRKRFNHDEHLRMALLAPTVYGHMPFEMVGIIDPELAWRLRKLAPRMPQSIKKWDIAPDGGLKSIEQYAAMQVQGKPIPIENLAVYCWEKEGANWTGRSMLRPLFRHWLVKDRLIRVDAIKNERFGSGVPKGTAPQGGDPADYQRMASAIRASESGGVGVPQGGDISIEGIRGTLPDTIASIRYHDESMARSFLAMFMQLGQTETGSRALGESFIDFFVGSLSGFANWYAQITNEYVIEDIVDWNYGIDENAPLLTWRQPDDDPLGPTELADLIQKGALVVDDEMEQWIRQRFNMPDWVPGTEPITPSGPVKIADVPPGTDPSSTPPSDQVAAGGKPSKGTPKDKRLKENKGATVTNGDRLSVKAHGGDTHDQKTHGNRKPPSPTGFDADVPEGRAVSIQFHGSNVEPTGNVRVIVHEALASSQTVAREKVGHRDPTDVELRAQTDFERLQQEWQSETDKLVKAWGPIKAQQIEDLVTQIEAAVQTGNINALAGIQTQVLGGDIILEHAQAMAKKGVDGAIAEAKAQGVDIPAGDVADIATLLQARSDATALLLARSIAQSAVGQALNRYGVDSSLSAKDVADGVRGHLEGLTDGYLNDQLGGMLTAAQNSGRRAAMGRQAATVYSSELLDHNTCDFCSEVDGTSYADVSAAEQDYPTGGFKDCAGGPRCRGTLVAVYDEGDPEADT